MTAIAHIRDNLSAMVARAMKTTAEKKAFASHFDDFEVRAANDLVGLKGAGEGADAYA